MTTYRIVQGCSEKRLSAFGQFWMRLQFELCPLAHGNGPSFPYQRMARRKLANPRDERATRTHVPPEKELTDRVAPKSRTSETRSDKRTELRSKGDSANDVHPIQGLDAETVPRQHDPISRHV